MARIIRFGREGDVPHLVAYSNLLADKIEEAGDKDSADRIRKIAQGEYGATIIPMTETQLASAGRGDNNDAVESSLPDKQNKN